MCLRALPAAILATLTIVLLSLSSAHAQEGHITGRVSLMTPKGEIIYGDWVRVFLTTEPADIPSIDLTSSTEPWERQSLINSAHTDFFVNFREKHNHAGYVVNNKLSRPDGTFAFSGIPAGRYYVVITFPTVIGGFKCAWQREVDVVEEKSMHVELNGENLALPSY